MLANDDHSDKPKMNTHKHTRIWNWFLFRGQSCFPLNVISKLKTGDAVSPLKMITEHYLYP
uniref:Uncharacterized protein n=1 Tax=Arundo donax TaxID=35708 RepID=A0A0A9HR02_ARUDO